MITEIPVHELLIAARRKEVLTAMSGFMAEADRLIAAQPATCWNRGKCCRFGQYGHRLFVTALEVVHYLATPEESNAASQVNALPGIQLPVIPAGREDACPHAFEGRCHARRRRPLGCRIFFCDPSARHWQGPLTETLLARLKVMHRELNVPYFYTDWMHVLRALASAIN